MEDKVEEKLGIFGKVRNTLKMVWLVLQYFFNRAVDALAKDILIIQREADLFLGSALLAVGLLGFESSRYCDGNVNDHISCTRPATYYYFNTWDIALIVLGVFFVLVWYFKSQERAVRPKQQKN
jgi:hypothetical protein